MKVIKVDWMGDTLWEFFYYNSEWWPRMTIDMGVN